MPLNPFQILPIESSEEQTSLRVVRINKRELHNDFDAWNSKQASGPVLAQADTHVKDAIDSDSTETEDGLLVERIFDNVDADLRIELQSVLAPDTATEATNIQDYTEEYVYNFMLPVGWTGSLGVVATKIHEFLLKNALVQWGEPHGLNQGLVVRAAKLRNDLQNLLLPYSVRVDMQPFGPAYKFRD